MDVEIEEKQTNDDASNELLNKVYGETTTPSIRKSTKTGTYRQVLLTALVTPVMISLAHVLAYPALIVPQLRSANGTLNLDKDDGSWYTSVYSLSSPVGSLIAGIIMDKYGRKVALATPLVPMIIMWIVTATATDRAVLFISRILIGIIGGFGPPVCQIYLAESTDSDFRGITINVGYVSLSVGFLLTFALGAIMDWRSLAWSGVIFPTITLVGLFIIPETPLWLIRHGHIDKAYTNLLWLRGDANIARNELNENLSRLNQEKESPENSKSTTTMRDFLQPFVLKPIVIIFSFIMLFNLSGTYLIIYYAIDILSQVELTIKPENSSIIISIVRLIVTIGFCWLFMTVNRRTIYLIAGVGSTCSTLLLTAYLYMKPNVSAFNVWITGCLLLVYVATNTGFMIAPGFLTGELLPAKIRGQLAGYIYTYFSIVTFVLNKFFPHSNEYIGLTGVLFVFGLASLATTALMFFMVPETKGISLIEIEKYFQSNGWMYKKRNQSTDN